MHLLPIVAQGGMRIAIVNQFSVHKWSGWSSLTNDLHKNTVWLSTLQAAFSGSSWCLVVNNKILFVDNYASLSCDMSCLSIFWQKELSMVNRFDKFLWISNKYTIIWCISNAYLLVESVLYRIFDWQDFTILCCTMPLSFIFIDHLNFMMSNMKLLTRTLPKIDGKFIFHCLSRLKICMASCPNINGLTLQISCLKHAFVVQPTWLPLRSISLCKNDQFAEWKFLLCSLRPIQS